MTRYPLMQPESGLKDLFYTPKNNTKYLLHELASSEIRDVSIRLLSLHGRVHHQDVLSRVRVTVLGFDGMD